MDKVITRSLLRSYYNGIKPLLETADDSDIDAVIDGITFDEAPEVVKLTVDGSRVRDPAGANFISYIHSVGKEGDADCIYVPVFTGKKETEPKWIQCVFFTNGRPDGFQNDLWLNYNGDGVCYYLEGDDSIFNGYDTIVFILDASRVQSSIVNLLPGYDIGIENFVYE